MGPRPATLPPLLCNFTVRSEGLRSLLLLHSYPHPQGTMQLQTRQGTTLSLHLAAIHRIPAGQPDPIVEFRYRGGILCSSYWLATFQGIPVGEGLCLMGGTDTRQDISAETVAACQTQCAAWMAEVSQ
jgi:hypothetical protein